LSPSEIQVEGFTQLTARGGQPLPFAGEHAVERAGNRQAVQSEYDANTRMAIEQGVFGVPSFVIGDELFWGQDRLDFVARALA
jgi:2-hydroxychromene-2-carboxylate isomerase